MTDVTPELEKAARALMMAQLQIAPRGMGAVEQQAWADKFWMECLIEARAVIASLLPPTERVVGAMSAARWQFEATGTTEDFLAGVHQAALRTVLGEPDDQ